MARSPSRHALALGAVLVAVLALASGSTPAFATAPGRNGRIVVDAELNVNAGFELYTMRPNGTAVKRLTFFDDGGNFSMNPAWSPDGTRVVFTAPGTDTGDVEIWTVNADGSGMTQLTHDGGADDLAPQYSLDGATIVFARFAFTGFFATIWSMHADGSGMTELTADWYDSFCPTFTPDGRIAFVSSKGGLVSAIWTMDPDGSNARRLTPASMQAGCPDVSPDGTRIVASDNQNSEKPTSIFTMRIDGSEITYLTNQSYHHDIGARFSPDGTRIVFASDRGYGDNCCFDLFTMNTDGSNVVQMTSNLTVDGCPENGNCTAPSWGPRPTP
jgi:Tol biopolymer transport system component